MRTNRPLMLGRLTTLVLVAAVAAGCSSPTSADASVFDQARDLGQDLSRAAAATQDAITGYAEPQFAAKAIDRASASSRQLAETATKIQTPELRTTAGELVSIANQAVSHLTQGDVATAEALRRDSFVPLASQIAQMKGKLPAATQPPTTSGGSSIAVAFVIVVLVVGGVAGLLMRGRNRQGEAAATAVRTQPTTTAAKGERHERTWDGTQPLDAPQIQVETPTSEPGDTARTTRIRPIDIELRSLLEATIEQAKEREWQVSLVCPEVQISGDPVRVQRAILATLGNAFLEGAELVGIVVDVVDGQVLLSIGHDAPIDDQKAEDIAVRLANQLAPALDGQELGWSVASDGEIYLTTVSAGTMRALEAGVEVQV